MAELAIEKFVHSLELEITQTQSAIVQLNEDLSKIRKRLVILNRLSNFAKLSKAARHLTDSTIIWRPGAVLIGVTLIGGIGIAITRSPILGCLSVAMAATFMVLLILYPSDEKVIGNLVRIEFERESLVVKLPFLSARIKELDLNLRLAFERLKTARVDLEHERLINSSQYRRTELLKENWKAMRSVELEHFLARVLTELGYSVQTTKVTGDQGVDLIASCRGQRIAIQVKGYESSVSNGAVQEVHAGKSHYGCDFSCAITNSRFTKSAIALAASVGCSLIDEDLMTSFVLGEIDLL